MTEPRAGRRLSGGDGAHMEAAFPKIGIDEPSCHLGVGERHWGHVGLLVRSLKLPP